MLDVTQQAPSYRPKIDFFSKYSALLDILFRISDILIVALTALACYGLRFGDVTMALQYRGTTVIVLLLTLIIFTAGRLYGSWRGLSLTREILRVWLAWGTVLVSLFIVGWSTKTTDSVSRLWLGSWFASTLVLFALSRIVGRYFLGAIRAHGIDTRRVVLVGATEAGRRIVEVTRANPRMGLKVTGYVATPYDNATLDNLPCIGDLDSFMAADDSVTYEQLWIALPMHAESDIRRLIATTDDTAVTVRLVPDLFNYDLLNQQATDIGGTPVITLRGSRITGHARVLKAIEDRVLAAAILVLISPVLVVLAIAVKLSSKGPVFYRQERVGLDGETFEMLKFRSMSVDVEKSGIQWGGAKDKQTTCVGRFMRKTSLDELPQFLNVLRGDMSIVGPRPERPMFVHKLKEQIPQYMHKHLVKAGITGWAQVNGWRGDTNLTRRIEHDLHYIRHWSVALDLRIIAKTAVMALFSKNAS